MGGSEGGEWVRQQRDRRVGLTTARLVGGSEGGDGDGIGL